jgi:hypothetical protein
MHFNVESIDDHKGVATVKVTESQEEKYLNKIFQFFNLRPYFIEQNKKIGSSFKQKKTSEITENDFKNNFITMSDAFVNRHANDLSISLVPNDHKQILTANLTFVDIKTKEPITLTYKYDFNQKSTNWSLMITIGGIASIGILVAGLLIYKKIRKPKLQ